MKNLTEVAQAIAKEHGLTNTKAMSITRSVIRNIANGIISLEADSRDRVTVAQFGNFAVKKTNARTVKSLRTGEAVEVPAGIRISFKAADLLKKAVAEGAPMVSEDAADAADAADVEDLAATTTSKAEEEVEDLDEIPDLDFKKGNKRLKEYFEPSLYKELRFSSYFL